MWANYNYRPLKCQGHISVLFRKLTVRISAPQDERFRSGTTRDRPRQPPSPGEGQRRLVIVQLLREGIGQARETTHAHSHAEVLALHEARGDMARVGLAGDADRPRPEARGRAVAEGTYPPESN